MTTIDNEYRRMMHVINGGKMDKQEPQGGGLGSPDPGNFDPPFAPPPGATIAIVADPPNRKTEEGMEPGENYCDYMARQRGAVKDDWHKLNSVMRAPPEEVAYPPVPGPASPYHAIAKSMADTVVTKQEAYGDSFGRSGEVLKILYPAGISREAMPDALTVVRVIDKLFRVATRKNAFDENPWMDVCGYSLLAIRRDGAKGAR